MALTMPIAMNFRQRSRKVSVCLHRAGIPRWPKISATMKLLFRRGIILLWVIIATTALTAATGALFRRKTLLGVHYLYSGHLMFRKKTASQSRLLTGFPPLFTQQSIFLG